MNASNPIESRNKDVNTNGNDDANDKLLSNNNNRNNNDSNNDNNSNSNNSNNSSCSNHNHACARLLNFYEEYEILILFVMVILLAKWYPPLGAHDVMPQITATWIAVVFIFVVAGLDLKTEEFQSAFQEFSFNTFVQTFNFVFVSLFVYGFTRILLLLWNTTTAVSTTTSDLTTTTNATTNATTTISLAEGGSHELKSSMEPLVHGMIICSCLPMAINMVFILTKTAGGDEAAAILNAAFGNMIGVFISPLLILGYLGVSSGEEVNLLEVFSNLAVRIVIPLMVGQVIQKQSTRVVHWMKVYKRQVKKAQIYALVFIVYTVFCTSYDSGMDLPIQYVLTVILLQFVLLCTLSAIAWFSLTNLFPNQPELCVMGLFGCTHKTISVGVPMINAMYEGSSNVGFYTLPILIWHPMQLLVGSMLAPHLNAYIERKRMQLTLKEQQQQQQREDEEKCIVEILENASGGNHTHDDATAATTTYDDDAVRNERSPLVPQGLRK